MPEFEIVVQCRTERMREIIRNRLGTKPTVLQVTDHGDLQLIVRCHNNSLVKQIAEHCGGAVVADTAPLEEVPVAAPVAPPAEEVVEEPEEDENTPEDSQEGGSDDTDPEEESDDSDEVTADDGETIREVEAFSEEDVGSVEDILGEELDDKDL